MIDSPEEQKHLKGLTVLFVEDEEDACELYGEFLSRIVGALFIAKNGAEGLEAWRQQKPDIIITDIRMPLMDGLSMLREIRNVDTRVPVIIMSAFEESDYLKQSIELSVSGYLVKPLVTARFAESLLKCARALLVEKKLYQKEGNLQKALQGLHVHQDELEQQNEELQRTQNELDAVRARYFDLYDLAPFGYLTLNEQGFFLEANIAAASMLCVGRSELLRKSISRFIFPEDQYVYYLHRNKVFELSEVQAWEMRLVRADGSIFLASLRAIPAQNGEYWIAFSDITEQKLIEAELLQSKAAAEAANRAKSLFLATMSHEIRTPLSAMLGNVELLGGTPLTPDQQECLKDCKSASRMLLQVINDVLDYSKIEAGKLDLVNDTVSITSVSRQLVKMFSASAIEEGLELTISLADDLPEYISCDQQRLRQIISNLLGNAIKFTRQGSVSLEITRETITPLPLPDPPPLVEEEKALLRIVVTDTGIGIPHDKLDHIFDSFTQVEDFSTRTTTGTGLGLPICRCLLALMGGSITVASVPGEGSVFTVMLPVEVCKPRATAQTEAQTKTKSPPRNILLADDEKFGRTVAQKLLQHRGYRVTAVENGAELLDALQKDKFEILLTDISMPDMDGTTVARIIRSGKRDGINPLIPIIAMTAHAFSDDRERFLAAGINGYVAKPINLEELFVQIEELCSMNAG
jgi:PAS domain S-box-containing protein